MDSTTIFQETEGTFLSPINNVPGKWKKSAKYAAAALGGVIGIIAPGAVLYTGKTAEHKPEPQPHSEDEVQTPLQEPIEEQVETQEDVHLFESSFNQARLAGEKVFEFEGVLYHTYTKEEWAGLSIEEKREVTSGVKTSYQPSSHTPTSEPVITLEPSAGEEINDAVVAEGPTPEPSVTVEPVANLSDSPEDQPFPVQIIATLPENDMELETAISLGREEGADLVPWHGDLYPTCSEEEYHQMPVGQQSFLKQIADIQHIKQPFFASSNEPADPSAHYSPIVTEIDYDFDGDGVKDNILYVESVHGDTMFIDTAHSGQYNIVMMDSTGDGNFDTQLIDTTGDGFVDTKLVDTNGDGIFDTVYHKDPDGDWIAGAHEIENHPLTPELDLGSIEEMDQTII